MKKNVLAAALCFSLSFVMAEEAILEQTNLSESAESTHQIEQTEQIDPTEQTSAENSPAADIDGSLVVTKITFDGLKRTKNSYLQSRVKKFIGGTVAETDLHALETLLQSEGVFSDISLSLAQTSETEAEITVTLTEKITFIPIPFVMASNDGVMGGGMLMDTNAFGVKSMCMLGGFFSSDSQMAMLMLSDQPKDFRQGLSLSFSFQNGTPEVVNTDDDTVLAYKNIGFSAGMGVSQKFGEHVTASLGGKFSYLSVSDKDGWEDCVDSITQGTATLSLGYAKPDWNGWFMNTTSLTVSAEVGVSNDSDLRFPQIYTAKASLQKPLVPRLRLYGQASGAYGINTHISAYQKQSAASVNILPGDFVSERLAGGNAGLEFALVKGKYGTVSVYGDYQAAVVQDWDDDYEFVHGPNGGLRVYLAKIAFPALGVNFGYNVPKNYWQFSAALGMSF